MTVIGLGTQDDLAEARDFVSDTKVTIRMLWDQSGLSWQRFNVPIQPASVLVDRSGKVVKGWQGVVDFNKVLKALSTD